MMQGDNRDDFLPSPNQVRKGEWICGPCRRKYERNYRLRRKAEGRPIVSAQMPRSWHLEYERSWRQKPEVRERLAKRARQRANDPRERHKHVCRWKTRYAITAGRLRRQPCEICNSSPTDAHHDDYSKPLEVRWLCRQCHTDLHAKAKE